MDAGEVVRQGLDRWNAHDRDGYAGLCSNDVDIQGPGGLKLSGAEGWLQFFDAWHEAFPDNRIEAEVFMEGERACEEARFTGTHTGTLHGPAGDVPATGRRVAVPYAATYHVHDDKVTRVRMFWDQLEVLSQLGLAP